MKRIISLCFILISLFSSAFAYNWFDDRYFELSVGSKFGLSNNSMQIGDILKKDLVIDLRKLADEMPKNGWSLNSYVVPEVSLKLNLRKVEIGLTTGTEIWSEAGISKDLFDYIGKGNSLYQTVSISQNINADAFAYEEISVRFNIRDFKIVVKPTFFMPVMHAGSSNGTLRMNNLSDGSFNIDYSSDIELYSAFAVSGGGGFKGGLGFDLGGSVSYPLFDFLTLTGNIRMPIVPGHLKYKTVQTTSLHFNTTVDKIINGNIGDQNFSSSHGDSQSADYMINRPMKFSAFADFTPFGNWVVFTGGLGLGFRHPFTDDKDSFEFFGEYYLAASLRLLNILKLTLSTEYYEKLFIHQLSFSANARIIELVLGINAQAAGFLKSCSGGGVGGLFAIKLGY